MVMVLLGLEQTWAEANKPHQAVNMDSWLRLYRTVMQLIGTHMINDITNPTRLVKGSQLFIQKR